MISCRKYRPTMFCTHQIWWVWANTVITKCKFKTECKDIWNMDEFKFDDFTISAS